MCGIKLCGNDLYVISSVSVGNSCGSNESEVVVSFIIGLDVVCGIVYLRIGSVGRRYAACEILVIRSEYGILCISLGGLTVSEGSACDFGLIGAVSAIPLRGLGTISV